MTSVRGVGREPVQQRQACGEVILVLAANVYRTALVKERQWLFAVLPFSRSVPATPQLVRQRLDVLLAQGIQNALRRGGSPSPRLSPRPGPRLRIHFDAQVKV